MMEFGHFPSLSVTDKHMKMDFDLSVLSYRWTKPSAEHSSTTEIPGSQSWNMNTFVTLLTGQRMPMVGLGTWKSAPGQVKQAVLTALECGYRHIDCAAAYGNEKEVGEALALWVGPGKALQREEVFVTSKLWNTKHDPEDVEEACRTSLAHLGLSYLDLYLMHWPMAFQRGTELMPRKEDGSICYSDTHYRDTWTAMESLVDRGLVKAIGLSNFNTRQTDDIISIARHKPVVNQVECHPYLSHTDLLSHCRSVGVCVTAYSPLGSGDRPWASADEPSLLADPRFGSIAQRYQKTPAQVILRWHIQRGVVCIPKSVTPSRIQQNLNVFDFSLSEEDMKLIESFNCNKRFIVPAVERDGKKVWRDAEHPHFPFHDPY